MPIVGIAIAIAGTTTMEAAGLSYFSAFALLPLISNVLFALFLAILATRGAIELNIIA